MCGIVDAVVQRTVMNEDFFLINTKAELILILILSSIKIKNHNMTITLQCKVVMVNTTVYIINLFYLFFGFAPLFVNLVIRSYWLRVQVRHSWQLRKKQPVWPSVNSTATMRTADHLTFLHNSSISSH